MDTISLLLHKILAISILELTVKFNLVDPPVRNTINVPIGGWSVIRFIADNPASIQDPSMVEDQLVEAQQIEIFRFHSLPRKPFLNPIIDDPEENCFSRRHRDFK
ncbi:hypothetical protein Leryth_017809, partial [Lithospermum erythrorhizon]